MTYDQFYGRLWKQGDSLVITVPANLVRYAGYKEGDKVKVIMKRETQDAEE